MQRWARDVFHNDKRLAPVVVFYVEDCDQMRTLEIHALADSPQLDVLVVLDSLDRYFPAAVADGVVHLAESAASGSPLDGISFEGSITVLVLIPLHLPFTELCAPFSGH